jgi:ABC-type antimicrobial peptide transport system permease subunit
MAISNSKMIAVAVGIMIVIIITAAYVVFKDNLPETDENGDKPVSFTFFDVGANTPLTESLRETLRDRLGSDAIETQTTVNLEILYKDFIREYLPEIYKLHRLLNGDAGQRIEYNTIKLRYRYIPRENYPFDYVEFLFSNYSQKPI